MVTLLIQSDTTHNDFSLKNSLRYEKITNQR